MVSIITYETLYDLLRREKVNPELQKIEKDFLQNLKKYLESKQSILESQQSKSSIFSKKESEMTLKQIENTKRVIKELYERREAKIISLALSSSKTKEKYDAHILLSEELNLYEAIRNILNQSRQEILEPLFLQETQEAKAIKSDNKALKQIKFLNPVPQFVGTDLNHYGPFEEEYIASLPEDVASLLIKSKRAEEI